MLLGQSNDVGKGKVKDYSDLDLCQVMYKL